MWNIQVFVTIVATAILCEQRCAAMDPIHQDLGCSNGKRFRAKSSAYFPSMTDSKQGGLNDMEENPLRTLQDFLKDEDVAQYVTVALDVHTVPIEPHTAICIPEINRFYGRHIRFEFRDTGSSMLDACFSKIRICVKDKTSSYLSIVNQYVTIVVPHSSFKTTNPT